MDMALTIKTVLFSALCFSGSEPVHAVTVLMRGLSSRS